MIFNHKSGAVLIHSPHTHKKTFNDSSTIMGSRLIQHAAHSKNERFLYIGGANNDKFGIFEIDEKYLQNCSYSNGERKISTDFNIILKNYLDLLNAYDIAQLLLLATHNRRTLQISEIFEFIRKAPLVLDSTKKIMKIAKNNDLIANTINEYNFKTHLYQISDFKLKDYCGVKTTDYISIFSESTKQCYYTDAIYQKMRNMGAIFGGTGANYYDVRNGEGGGVFASIDYMEANFKYCDNCGYYERFEDFAEDDHLTDYYGVNDICLTCYDDFNERFEDEKYNDAIRDYSYRPSPIFHTSGGAHTSLHGKNTSKLFAGIEIEIEARNADAESDLKYYASNLMDNVASNAQHQPAKFDFLYCKNDSSICDNYEGFEIVSHPATFDYWRKFNFKNTVSKLSADFKSFYARNCGMHIHLSRAAFNDLDLYKFNYFLNHYEALTYLIAQRRRKSEFDSWSAFTKNDSYLKSDLASRIRRQKRNKKDYGNKFNYSPFSVRTGSRYQVLNLQNSATVEIRCFKGNLTERGIRKNLEFCEALFYFVKCNSYREIKNDKIVIKFVDYVAKNAKQYKHLNHFLNELVLTQTLEVCKQPRTIENN
tara:strand:- start:24130 stop:25911 length:1782 start_codon:yes stop_codon:yes gene_type:complete